MCGRYYIAIDDHDEEIAEYFRQAQGRAFRMGTDMIKSGEVRPTNIAPVLAPSAAERSISAFPMRWGFSHPTRGMLVFNTRSETADQKSMFAESVTKRRCAIPASCYFEWKKGENDKKQRYSFNTWNDEILFLAGLYLKVPGISLPCFTILTMDAAPNIKDIHARMPVILPRSNVPLWVSGETPFSGLTESIITDIKAVRG